MTTQGQSVTIRIVCREPSHEEEPVTVAEFWNVRDREENETHFIEATGTDLHTPSLNLEQRTGVFLGADDQPVGDDVSGVDIARSRHSIRCATCGLSLAARAEKLYPALRRLMAAGVSEVDLAHFLRAYRGS